MKPITILTCLCLLTLNVAAQKSDSTRRTKQLKNVIKVNLSSTLLYKNSPLIEYERVIRKNQTASLQAGLVSLPFSSGFISDALQMKSSVEKKGYTLTLDYRFYLPKENRNPAPHGVYIGPYASYYHFNNENNMSIKDSNDDIQDVILKSNLNITNIGFQLGYQFVLWKRMTIDCILFGPSVSNYNVKMQLTGDDLSAIDVDESLQEIIQELASKYPGLGSLLDSELVEFKGRSSSWSGGFRYSLHVGFRF